MNSNKKTENKSESYNFFIYILSKAKTGYIWQNQSRKFHKGPIQKKKLSKTLKIKFFIFICWLTSDLLSSGQ